MRVLGKHLAFQHDEPDMVRDVIPLSGENNGWFATPFTLQTATLLRSIGVPAPSPIRSEYKWAGRFTPFKHQMETSEFFTLNKRAFCLSDMGSGKTISALWAADYLKKEGIINRVLIISPLSTLDVVWGREIFTNFTNRSYNILHGAAAKRKKLLAEPVDFYVINHHGVGVILDDLKKRSDIDLIIVDEAACYRNSQAKMSKVLKSIITPEKWVWGLTGSPTPQSPTDAYGIAKLIKPENVPFSFTRFKQDIMLQVGPFKWVPRRNAEQAVARILSPAIRYSLRDCVDLPETIVQYRSVEMSPEQAQHYNKILRTCITEIRGIEVTAVNAAVMLNKLCQIASGVVYGVDGEVVKLDFGHRIQELDDIVNTCNEKVIVFVPFTGALKAVKAELTKRGHNCEVVDGSTSNSERLRIFDAMQQGDKLKVLVANPKAIAHGITLTAASTIVWFAPITSNEYYQQANGRIVRPGQKHVTNIINISSTKEEVRIYEGLQNKARFQDIVLEIAKK